jgi:hypothetical protein
MLSVNKGKPQATIGVVPKENFVKTIHEVLLVK